MRLLKSMTIVMTIVTLYLYERLCQAQLFKSRRRHEIRKFLGPNVVTAIYRANPVEAEK